MPSGKVERVGGNPGSVSRSRSHRPSVHSAVARELACELGQGNAGIPASSSSVLNGCKKTARDPGLAQGSSEAHINHHAQHVGTIPASTPPPSSLPHLPLCPSALPPTHPTPLSLPPPASLPSPVTAHAPADVCLRHDVDRLDQGRGAAGALAGTAADQQWDLEGVLIICHLVPLVVVPAERHLAVPD